MAYLGNHPHLNAILLQAAQRDQPMVRPGCTVSYGTRGSEPQGYFEFHVALPAGTAAKSGHPDPGRDLRQNVAAPGHLYGARLRTSRQICHSSLSCAGRSANTYVPVGTPARSISAGMETVPSLATTAVACWLRRAFRLFVRT